MIWNICEAFVWLFEFIGLVMIFVTLSNAIMPNMSEDNIIRKIGDRLLGIDDLDVDDVYELE